MSPPEDSAGVTTLRHASSRHGTLSHQDQQRVFRLSVLDVVAVDHVTQSRRQGSDCLVEMHALLQLQQARIGKGLIHLFNLVPAFHSYAMSVSGAAHWMGPV